MDREKAIYISAGYDQRKLHFWWVSIICGIFFVGYFSIAQKNQNSLDREWEFNASVRVVALVNHVWQVYTDEEIIRLNLNRVLNYYVSKPGKEQEN